MNKIILGLIAAASISTAALANKHTDIDPRNRNQSAAFLSGPMTLRPSSSADTPYRSQA